MKFKTIVFSFLLPILISGISACSPKVGETAATVEEAEKILAKQNKKKAKAAKKEQKKAYKHFWSLQSKEAKKSIKRNKKRQKKIQRAKNRSEY